MKDISEGILDALTDHLSQIRMVVRGLLQSQCIACMYLNNNADMHVSQHLCIFYFVDISPEGRATTGSSAKPGQPVGQVKQASDPCPSSQKLK